MIECELRDRTGIAIAVFLLASPRTISQWRLFEARVDDWPG